MKETPELWESITDLMSALQEWKDAGAPTAEVTAAIHKFIIAVMENERLEP